MNFFGAALFRIFHKILFIWYIFIAIFGLISKQILIKFRWFFSFFPYSLLLSIKRVNTIQFFWDLIPTTLKTTISMFIIVYLLLILDMNIIIIINIIIWFFFIHKIFISITFPISIYIFRFITFQHRFNSIKLTIRLLLLLILFNTLYIIDILLLQINIIIILFKRFLLLFLRKRLMLYIILRFFIPKIIIMILCMYLSFFDALVNRFFSFLCLGFWFIELKSSRGFLQGLNFSFLQFFLLLIQNIAISLFNFTIKRRLRFYQL